MDLEDLKKQMKTNDAIFRKSFESVPQDLMRDQINNYYSSLLSSYESDKFFFNEIYLNYIELLNYYGQAYSSLQTFNNLIEKYKTPEISQGLFVREKARTSLVVSRTYLFKYQLLKNLEDDEKRSSKSFIKILLEAKRKLSKLYSEFLSGDLKLNQGQQIYCLENLGICYADLSRWYESLYYINKGIELDPSNVNLLSTKALVFDRLRDATCQSYTGQLLYQMLHVLEVPLTFPLYPEEAIQTLNELKADVENEIKRHNLKKIKLSDEAKKVEIDLKSVSGYLRFVSQESLFLNEHSDYCKCSRGMKDNIQIRSFHEHTLIDYVDPFELVLDSVKFDFIEARYKFYNSLKSTKIKGYHLRNLNPKQDYQSRIKETMLKDSFRLCLSIFDTIAVAMLEALEIDYEEIIKEKFEGKTKVYFTNIFECFIDPEFHQQNFYLNTLYSLSQDLNSSKSGHRDLKDIRNAIEHGIFLFKEHSDVELPFKNSNYMKISKSVMEEKTRVLLILTKSLIFSYTYFIRRQTKIVGGTC